jgi:hypothetical protein
MRSVFTVPLAVALSGAITVPALLLAPTAASGASGPRARTESGHVCTIVGTNGRDVLRGTWGRDVICGLGGNDVIRGLGGDDIIDAGTGNDRVYGGSGTDLILGGAGADRLYGESGRDDLSGGTGKDTLSGGASADILFGDTNNDTLRGGTGADSLIGGSGKDVFVGNSGADTCAYDPAQDRSRSRCTLDASRPRITGVSVTPKAIDTRSGPVTVVVRVSATDDQQVTPAISIPGLWSGYWSGNLAASGTRQSGTWEFPVTVPQGMPSGSFDVLVEARDGVHVTPTTTTVRGALTNTGVSYAEPTLTSFATTLPGDVIDTRNGGVQIRFSAGLLDPDLRSDAYLELGLRNVATGVAPDLDGWMKLSSGSPANGTFTATRTVSSGTVPDGRYDWEVRVSTKEGRTFTWVGPTLWAQVQGQAGYRLLPGARTVTVTGGSPANAHLPQLHAVDMPTIVGRGPANAASARLSLSDRDGWDTDGRLRATMYFQHLENPDVWLTAEQASILGEEQTSQADATLTLRFPEYAMAGQYRTWILLTDGYANQHHVWYGPAGQTPPTHVTGVPSTATIVTYDPATLFTNGATLTVG